MRGLCAVKIYCNSDLKKKNRSDKAKNYYSLAAIFVLKKHSYSSTISISTSFLLTFCPSSMFTDLIIPFIVAQI